MSTLSRWRKESRLALGFKHHYRRLLRWVRTVRLPQAAWRDYRRLCYGANAASLIRAHPALPPYEERPFNKYLNTRWSGGAKLRVAMASLQFIEQRFSPQALPALYNLPQRGILLGEVAMKEGGRLAARLMCSPFPREGDLELSLWVEDREKVYSLSFSATGDGTLYLAGLQGIRGDSDLIKLVTKQTHGWRPHNLLMALAWQFARSFQLTQIVGIANQYQVKSSYLKFSYDEFWQECGAPVAATEGWFSLPAWEPVKDIESIKSSRRSEYRRRLALRDALCGEMAQTLAAIQAAMPKVEMSPVSPDKVEIAGHPSLVP